jgi:DNA-binding response OmpR family regulator
MNGFAPSRPPDGPTLAVVADAGDWALRAVSSLLIANGFEVIPAHSVAQLLEQVERSHPHLILIGGTLGTTPAAECLRLLRAMSSFDRATPVVVASGGMVSEQERLEHLRAGAWETVGLPASSEALILRIRRFVDARVSSDQARVQSLIDPASGFYNLKGFLRRAGEEAAEAWRARRPLAFAVFAPDPTARDAVLAAPGAPAGQLLQRQLIEVFRRLGRRSDVVGRRGPVSFLVLAPATDEVGVRLMAERFLREMHHLALATSDGPEVPVRMLAGCHASGGPAAGGMDPRELLARAAGALRVVGAEPGSDSLGIWRHGVEEDPDILADPDELDPPLGLQGASGA